MDHHQVEPAVIVPVVIATRLQGRGRMGNGGAAGTGDQVVAGHAFWRFTMRPPGI